MKKTLFTFTLFIFTYNYTYCQISYGGNPFSKTRLGTYNTIPIIDMPEFDNSSIDNKNINYLKSFAFAKSFDVNINTYNSGKWEIINDSISIWQLGIRSKEAYSISLYFQPFKLTNNTKLFIYNKDYKFVLGAFTQKNNKASLCFPTEAVPGEIAYIELIIPTKEINDLLLSLKRVSHDYLDFYNIVDKTQLKSAGDCNIDVNCETDEKIRQVKNATFLFKYYHSGEGTEKLCNGTLINNTKQDTTPYFITAGHCLWDEETANSMLAYFDFDSYYCNGPIKPGYNTNELKAKTISTSNFVATTSNLDFTLAKLTILPPVDYKPYFAGWDLSASEYENVFCIHHPLGDAKKIAYDNDAISTSSFHYPNNYVANSFWKIDNWERGITEGGSSGSPLYDSNSRIIGTLTGGNAKCGNPINDFFTKFSYAWDRYSSPNQQLKYWLDPDNSGITTLDGFDPYNKNTNNCTQLDYEYDDTLFRINSSNDYWTGHNNKNITQFAQKFNIDKTTFLKELHINFADIIKVNSEPYIYIKIWADNGEMPGILLFEKQIQYNNLVSNSVNLFELDTLVLLTNSIYLGYQIQYDSIIDSIAVYQTSQTSNSDLNYFVYQSNTWSRIDEFTSNQITGSLDMKIVICDTASQEIIFKKQKYEIYYSLSPNPAKDYIIIDFGHRIPHDDILINLYDITGNQLQLDFLPYAFNKYKIPLTNYAKGFYFINVGANNMNRPTKFLIQ